MLKSGGAIGGETAQGAPGDALEFSASAGGAAFLIGKEKVIAKINRTRRFTTDTPDTWRREGQPYPLHGGRFTGDPAYFKHITSAAKMLLKEMGTTPKDYKYAVFHQPNGKFPTRVAGMIGFEQEQIEAGLVTPNIGNTYSGSVPLGLAAVLDKAVPGDRIFVTSYGSGAGSDAFDITVTDEMKDYQKKNAPTVEKIMENPIYVDYGLYTKYRGMIIMPE
jgi:hydroxymethylglutaryl-CoA synthase